MKTVWNKAFGMLPSAMMILSSTKLRDKYHTYFKIPSVALHCLAEKKNIKMWIADFVSQNCLIWMYKCICFVAFRADDALTPCFWANLTKDILVDVSNRGPVFLAFLSKCFLRVIFLSKMEHMLETCRFWSRWSSIFSFQFMTHLVGSPVHVSVLTNRRLCNGNRTSVMSKEWFHDYRHVRTSVRQIGFGGSTCLPNLYDNVDDRNLPTIWVR